MRRAVVGFKKEIIWMVALVVFASGFSFLAPNAEARRFNCYYDEYFDECFFLQPLQCVCVE